MTTTAQTSSRNLSLTGARVVAGLLGTMQLAGVVFFVFFAREEAVWLGPLVDVPVVALMVAGFLLKLGVALLPQVDDARRITMGFLAVAIGVSATLLKIPLYDEPEGVLVLAFDGLLLGLLLLAWRTARR